MGLLVDIIWCIWVFTLGIIEKFIPYYIIIEEDEWRFKIMRRAVMVFGCTLEDGTQITTEDYTSVKVFPNKNVEVTRADGSKEIINGNWVSYIPRFN